MRTVVVTGASQGIGRVIASAFGALGDTVVLAARNRAKLTETAADVEAGGGTAVVVETDVTSESSVAELAAAVLESGGPADVVVANSGVGGPSGVLWEIDPVEWDATFAVNVKGVFLTARALVPAMIEQRRGSVIVIGSISGKRPLYGRTPYTSTKLALVGMVRTLAMEAGEHGIRVNLISPGFVEGPRLDWVIGAQSKARGVSEEVVEAEFKAQSPIGRLTQPSDIADAAIYLASEQSSALTGVDLNVNAGVVMY